ncbi:MAG TPA: hypothetical protein VIP77_22770 [Jiangellaceae bacterium]
MSVIPYRRPLVTTAALAIGVMALVAGGAAGAAPGAPDAAVAATHRC